VARARGRRRCRDLPANGGGVGERRLSGSSLRTNGEQALAQAEETPPDLAIVDLEMPGTNGLDVIRRLKEMFRSAVARDRG